MPGWFGCREVRVAPYPVACGGEPEVFVGGRRDLGLPEDAVITLVVCSLESSFERKNPLGSVAAHRAAFGARADRVLWMRVGRAELHAADFGRLQAAVADLPNVRLDTRVLPRAEARAVMAACDIVLSLHRSEGFGLVPAEAMLLGRAVVATDFSGTTDFLDAGCGVPVPARMVPVVDGRGVFSAAGAVWAEPDLVVASAALVRLADDAGERRRLGTAARVAALARLGPEGLGAAVRGLGIAAGAPGPG